MELGGHDIVRVASQDSDALARCAVPDSNRLIIGGGELRPRVSSDQKVELLMGSQSKASHDEIAQFGRSPYAHAA
jgi:hypothetical protein